MRGFLDKMQDGGQHEKVSWKVVQLSSGLWAFSQSVPSMISCVAREVT